MRLPPEAYPILTALHRAFPAFRPAQHHGLALWVTGAVLAGSACQSAVIAALRLAGGGGTGQAVRQQLREWLYAGPDKAAPCQTQVDVTACFAPLLGWVLRWWRGPSLPLALDATYQRDRLVVLSVSVLYRGTALPVAWHVTAANRRGEWLAPSLGLLARLAPAVPAELPVLVLADRGLWSPRLWDAIRAQGWHPLLRIRPDATFRHQGGGRTPAAALVPGPGHAWVGAGTAFRKGAVQRSATLVVTWDADQAEPWLVLTDLAPTEVGPCWYGLRTWVELGFRAVKRLGWHWERTRRTDPDRVARHWLVLAVATLWVLAIGTREEDAEWRGREPANLRVAPPPPTPPPGRTISVFRRGVIRMRWQLLRQRRLWTILWLWPEPWPGPPAGLQLTVVAPAELHPP